MILNYTCYTLFRRNILWNGSGSETRHLSFDSVICVGGKFGIGINADNVEFSQIHTGFRIDDTEKSNTIFFIYFHIYWLRNRQIYYVQHTRTQINSVHRVMPMARTCRNVRAKAWVRGCFDLDAKDTINARRDRLQPTLALSSVVAITGLLVFRKSIGWRQYLLLILSEVNRPVFFNLQSNDGEIVKHTF